MLLLGHLGVSLGLAWLCEGIPKTVANWQTKAKSCQPIDSSAEDIQVLDDPVLSGSQLWDYRLVLVGAILPDLIDKPIGIFIMGHIFSNGRIFAHTALFTLSLLFAGAILWRHRVGLALLSLSYGSFMHLILDFMWTTPTTLLWPFFGLGFGRTDISQWLAKLLSALLHNKLAIITEAIGASIIGFFFAGLLRRQQLSRWIRSGQLSKWV